MKIQAIDKQVNFGWNRTTHLEMTSLALKEIKGLSNSEKRQVARYSQMPDFDKKEFGYLKNAHFYFPNSKNKSYGKGANNYNNAKSMFMEHLQQAVTVGNRQDFLKHAGYAIHYLQEMTVPVHTKSGGIISKIFEYKTHRDFEKGKTIGAKRKTQSLVENYTPNKNLRYSSLNDLFNETASFSQAKDLQINQFNKKNWGDIQQKCFDRGVSATKEFFAVLNRVTKGF